VGGTEKEDGGGMVLLLTPGGWEPEEGWYCPLARVNPWWWWVQERGLVLGKSEISISR